MSATNVEGIFRLSGSEKRIKELKAIFDSPDRYGKGLDWAGFTVHDAANVLRRYLNLLPEPIVPLDLYDRFRDPLRPYVQETLRDGEGGPLFPKDFKVNEIIATYQKLITELPPLNRQLLLYILDLLAVFASKSDENRMTAVNLAAIFQPCALSHPQHDMAVPEYKLSQDVLIFLIENQDHFLIGMRGTAADEKTVQEVQKGSTPPPGTPTTPGKKGLGRSGSSASAGADSIRKYGGVRRNVSTSSRQSRQSNGAPSPASPAPLVTTPSGGVHRSNTVPSKRSPGLPSTRLGKNSGSPSPTAAGFASRSSANRALSPGSPGTEQHGSASSPLATSAVGSSLTPPKQAPAPIQTGERQTDVPRERNVSNFFSRSPTESEKKGPNKLRKKRIPSASPSAHSSTHSLNGPHSLAASPGLHPTTLTEHPQIEGQPSNPIMSNTEATPPLTETPRAEQAERMPERHEDPRQFSNQLKPLASPTSSLHSHSSFNDQSDLDHIEDPATHAERAEKRSRWRLSRRKEEPHSLSSTLKSPKKVGSDAGAATSTSSVGSSARPRKSLQTEVPPSESTLIGSQTNETGGSEERKGGPIGWFKTKMREKREEKEAEKERTKSPPPSQDRQPSTALPTRGKSMEVKREEPIATTATEPAASQQSTQPAPPSSTQ